MKQTSQRLIVHLLSSIVILVGVVPFFGRGGVDPTTLRNAGFAVTNWNYFIMSIQVHLGEYMVIAALTYLIYSCVRMFRVRTVVQ